ncbi:DNA repair protein XRCC4 isoform X2 [Amaranthus tricolor]|uniref:DNA repair protein XRCC4 isoform X2 n=1 Tax=Amaranthus tricolor TaxID=29722 RepID=UPI0025912676|nr:DNA repair protein XRCC4 isoform X2 [Amaranthus tricolor]
MVTSTSQEETYARESCLKLEVGESSSSKESIFVKGTWFPSHFFLLITNGAEAWLCNALEEDVKERASQWDQSESEYVKFAEKYLGFQQPDSVYRFSDAGNGFRKLSWTFEKEGIKLEWRWRCKPSPNCKKTTAQVLDFLMDSNINLSIRLHCKPTCKNTWSVMLCLPLICIILGMLQAEWRLTTCDNGRLLCSRVDHVELLCIFFPIHDKGVAKILLPICEGKY